STQMITPARNPTIPENQITKEDYEIIEDIKPD
ncbi:unnamed protein product, partial [marine sediment metagenome]